MALVLWLLVALVPCLIGMGALRILYGSQTTQEMSLADYILTGGMICIGLAEAAHFGAVMLGWSFSRCTNVFLGEIIAVTLLAVLVVLLYRRKGIPVWAGFPGRGQAPRDRRISGGADGRTGFYMKKLPWVVFGMLVIAQLIYACTGQGVYVDEDMTLETVNSFLVSDAVYQVNPMTGRAYTQGLPLRLEILCLPTLYGAVSSIFGIAPDALVYEMVPGFVLAGCYLAYNTLAKYFFPKDSLRRGVFLAAVALLLSVGDYMYGMDGFGVMHAGFRGVTIRGAILIPYVFGLLLRKKYRLLLLCICAEACIVWTLYGMGACLLIAVLMPVLQLALRRYDLFKSREEERK